MSPTWCSATPNPNAVECKAEDRAESLQRATVPQPAPPAQEPLSRSCTQPRFSELRGPRGWSASPLWLECFACPCPCSCYIAVVLCMQSSLPMAIMVCFIACSMSSGQRVQSSPAQASLTRNTKQCGLSAKQVPWRRSSIFLSVPNKVSA